MQIKAIFSSTLSGPSHERLAHRHWYPSQRHGFGLFYGKSHPTTQGFYLMGHQPVTLNKLAKIMCWASPPTQGYNFQRSRKLTIEQLSGQWFFFETPEPEHLMDTHIASIDRETYDNLHQDLHLTSCDTCVVPFWFMVKAMTEDSTCDRDMRAHQTMCVKRSLSYIL